MAKDFRNGGDLGALANQQRCCGMAKTVNANVFKTYRLGGGHENRISKPAVRNCPRPFLSKENKVSNFLSNTWVESKETADNIAYAQGTPVLCEVIIDCNGTFLNWTK